MSSVLLLFTQQVWIMALTVEPAAHWPPEAEYLAVSSQLWAVNTSYWQEGKEALVSRVLALRFSLLLQVTIEESATKNGNSQAGRTHRPGDPGLSGMVHRTCFTVG